MLVRAADFMAWRGGDDTDFSRSADVMKAAMDNMKRRVMGMVGRAIINAVNDGSGLQSLQIEVLDDELHDEVERFQNYGFTAHPRSGAEAIVVRVGGTASHGIVIAVDDRRYRLRSLKEGEVAIYDDRGQIVHLKRDGILITSPDRVRVEAPRVDVIADSVNLGGTGGAPVARVGDSVAGGKITSGSSKVMAA